jgi:succinyl-diaminopimelate desuccinylase
VPTGAESGWSSDPFQAEVKDGILFGRGAVDMKGGIAAWVSAVAEVLAKGEPHGSLSFLITGDEEGPALHGTKRVVEALMAEGEIIDACIVGEPSSQGLLGDMIKIGRRGSLNTWITVHGKQGHVAYPQRAANPAPVLVRLLSSLDAHVLDDGYEAFQPSNLEITTIDIGNGATNVIPSEARARLNIRFNPSHTGDELIDWLNREAGRIQAETGMQITLEHMCSGEAFLTPVGPFVTLVQDAVEAELGRRPEASTTGGTSDARFIRALCPVLELGLVGVTMHQFDERVPTAELDALTSVYRRVIENVFAAARPAE